MDQSDSQQSEFTKREYLEELFPNCLDPDSLEIESAETFIYNCVAWSLNIDTHWLQPMTDRGPVFPWAVWPDPDARGSAIDLYVSMYRAEGFVRASKPGKEAGFDKVAIYWDDVSEEFLHVAKQLEDGRWHSKLGALSDVSHNAPLTLGPPGSQGGYGKLWGYMKRRKADAAKMTPVKRCLK